MGIEVQSYSLEEKIDAAMSAIQQKLDAHPTIAWKSTDFNSEEHPTHLAFSLLYRQGEVVDIGGRFFMRPIHIRDALLTLCQQYIFASWNGLAEAFFDHIRNQRRELLQTQDERYLLPPGTDHVFIAFDQLRQTKELTGPTGLTPNTPEAVAAFLKSQYTLTEDIFALPLSSEAQKYMTPQGRTPADILRSLMLLNEQRTQAILTAISRDFTEQLEERHILPEENTLQSDE